VLRALAIVFGVILLLPGACSLGFMALMLGQPNGGDAGGLALLWLICFAISFGGVMMIRSAIRGPRRRDPPS
jgi:hypothetical protein